MTQRAQGRGVEHPEDEVFLSPRVVDQRAFEEFSGALKTLVRDAAQQKAALESSSVEVKELGQQLRDATKELQAKVETAVRVVPTLDQRVARAEEAASRAEAQLAERERMVREAVASHVTVDREMLERALAAHLPEILRERLHELTRELAQKAIESVPAAAKAIEDARGRAYQARVAFEESIALAAEQSRAKADEARTNLETSVRQAIDLAGEHATRLDSMYVETLRKLDERAAEAVQQAQENAAKAATAAAGHAIDAARQTGSMLDKLLGETPARIAEFEDRAGLVVTEMEKRVARAGAQAREMVRSVEQIDASRVQELEKSLSSKAGEAIAQIKAALTQADAMGRQLASLAQQADLARQHLADSVLGSADRIDTMEKQLGELRQGQDLVRQSLHDALTRAQEADTALAAQAARIGTALEQSTQPTLNRLTSQVQQMGQWLTQLIQQCGDVGHRLERTVSEARAVSAGRLPPAPKG